MADLIRVKFEGDAKGILEGRLEDVFDMALARRLIKNAIDDTADAVEVEAKRQAPEETGALKLHPVDREDTRFGISTGGPAFGGQESVRGAKGQFVGAVPVGTGAGSIFAKSVITIAKEPEHAIWVHNGTGIYGPRKSMITAKIPGQRMKFPRWSKAIDRRPQWRLEAVKGQRPQPYLENAFLIINNTYVPRRIELLRAEIAAGT